MSEELLVEWPKPEICIMRMNRPQAYNALNRSMLRDMLAVVEDMSKTRVLMLAAGTPGFCSGADLKERRVLTDAEKYQHNRQINALANALAASPVCTIAAINGLALGGGLELALACDLRFASSDSVLGLTEARVGAIPGAGGTQRLPRLVGTARAFEMMYSGEPIGAETAAAWGLINEMTAPEELMTRCMAFAETVATRSRNSIGCLKAVVYAGLDVDLPAGLEVERTAVVDILKSDDYREGLAAFAEKRAPYFS